MGCIIIFCKIYNNVISMKGKKNYAKIKRPCRVSLYFTVVTIIQAPENNNSM